MKLMDIDSEGGDRDGFGHFNFFFFNFDFIFYLKFDKIVWQQG